MAEQDEIKLAKAMGFYLQTFPVEFTDGSKGMSDFKVWHSPSHQMLEPAGELPTPFTDANDDYAVLEWMREKTPSIGEHIKWASDDEGWIFFNALHLHKVDYQIGDYARAALKVLE